MVNPPPANHPPEYVGDDEEISLLDLLGVIAENLRLLIIGPIVAGLIGLVYAHTLTPIFTAKTTIIPPGQNSGGGAAALLGQLGDLGALSGAAAGSLKTSSIDQYMAYLESNTLRDKLIEEFKLMERFKVKYQEQAREVLKTNSKLKADKKSGLIIIEVSDKDPQFAANLANAYVKALSQMLGKLANDDAKSRRKLFEQQLIEVTEKSYRSPFVREAIMQSVIREYENAILDQKKDRPFIQQVDVAEVPELKSYPIRSRIAIVTALLTGILLLLFVFVRNALQNAKQNPEVSSRLESIFSKFRIQLPW